MWSWLTALCMPASGGVISPITEHQAQAVDNPVKHETMCEGLRLIAEYPHINPLIDAISRSNKFMKWVKDFNDNEIELEEFHITDADFFGPVEPNRLGFVKGFGKARDKETRDTIPAIAFIRGGAVAVLIVVKVKETGNVFILLCRQLRFPAGRAMIEACAGMVDERSNNVIGVVFNEVREETGFLLNLDSLIDLGKITPSAGGCDECIYLYAWETEISQEEFEDKQKRVFGEGKYEKIKLLFYPYDNFDDILDDIGDVKAECCWRRYQRYKNRTAPPTQDAR